MCIFFCECHGLFWLVDCITPQAGIVVEKRDSYSPTATAQVQESKPAVIIFFTSLLFLTAAATYQWVATAVI